MPFSTLELVWSTREGGGGATRRDYLDFVVDGRSLQDRLPPSDTISPLGWGFIERTHIGQLLMREPPESPTGRVPLYVCAECGDLGCGAVMARIEATADAIVWSDFAWEVDYEDAPGEDGVGRQYEGIGPFEFRKAAYWSVLNGRLAQGAGNSPLQPIAWPADVV